MSYSCKILLDSISPTGKRLTTMEVTFPRCVLAEAETHRVLRGFGGNVEELIIRDLGINVDENLSRNSASSRAIPISKMVQRVREDPFIPEKWGKPVKGMGAKEYWESGSSEDMTLTREWNNLRQQAMYFCTQYAEIGNKEDLNRALEPFMWHTAILTATEWDNFFKLRTNSAADWKIRKIADLMYEAYHAFDSFKDPAGDIHAEIDNEKIPLRNIAGESWSAIKPQKLNVGEWHCPLVYEEDNNFIDLQLHKLYPKEAPHKNSGWYVTNFRSLKKKISVARCARISYLTHDGKRDIEKDLELYEKLVGGEIKHMSPFEHVATPYFDKIGGGLQGLFPVNHRSGNFIGWKQMRKEFADENCTNFRKE